MPGEWISPYWENMERLSRILIIIVTLNRRYHGGRFAVVPADDIYAETGIQFSQVNGLYDYLPSMYGTPKILQAAEKLVTIPDLFNFWLTGVAACEFTNATTLQFYSLRQHDWARQLLTRLVFRRISSRSDPAGNRNWEGSGAMWRIERA